MPDEYSTGRETKRRGKEGVGAGRIPNTRSFRCSAGGRPRSGRFLSHMCAEAVLVARTVAQARSRLQRERSNPSSLSSTVIASSRAAHQPPAALESTLKERSAQPLASRSQLLQYVRASAIRLPDCAVLLSTAFRYSSACRCPRQHELPDTYSSRQEAQNFSLHRAFPVIGNRTSAKFV
jgi:hypothetical protein